MKKLYLALVIGLSIQVWGQHEEHSKEEYVAPAAPVVGTVYGDTMPEMKKVKSIDKVVKKVHRKDVKNTLIKGKVTEVCPSMGCWLKLETEGNSSVLVRMRNHSFFVPKDLVGKNVVIKGDARLGKTSVEDLKHYAKEAGKTQEEIEAITKPKESVRITARSVKVVE